MKCPILSIALASTILFLNAVIASGQMGQPLMAQLDQASDIVVGKITSITPIEDPTRGSHCGRATLQIEEQLKGTANKTIQFTVVTSVDPDWRGQVVPQVNHVGDRGVLMVEGDDGDLLDEDPQVIKKMLLDLRNREWSAPVNGLQASAMLIPPPESAPDRPPSILFALRNATDHTLYVPDDATNDFLRVKVTDGSDTLGFLLNPGPLNNERVSCASLAAGKITYPYWRSIDLAWHQKLAPGKYSVVIYGANHVTSAMTPAQTTGLTAWTGELAAPPLKLVIPPAANSR